MKKIFLIFVSISILTLCISIISSARLPTVGGDSDQWGSILNEFLNVSFNESGELRNDTISTNQIINGTITDADISDTTNLTLGDKITFAFGEIIDNLVDGFIRITGNLRVEGTGNFSGTIYINNATDVSIWMYNQTTPAITYTDAALVANNASWLSTYNETYATWAYNQTIPANTYTNSQIDAINTTTNIQSLINGTNIWLSSLNVTGTSYLGNIVISADNITTNNIISKSGNISFFNSTNSEIVRFLDDGRVGIGTTSPTEKLMVNGSLRVQNSSGTLALYVNDSTGNVGIGTTSPGAKLQIDVTKAQASNGIDGLWIRNTVVAWDAPTTQNLISMRDQSDVTLGQIKSFKSATGIWGFSFDGWNSGVAADLVTILGSGNVGIGTSSPGYKLTATAGGATGTGANDVLHIRGGVMSTANDATGIFLSQWDGTESYGALIRLVTTQSSPGYLNPRLDIGVQNTDTSTKANIGTKMTITGSGYIYAPSLYSSSSANNALHYQRTDGGHIYEYTSSEKSKKNIRPLEIDSSIIYNLSLKTYETLDTDIVAPNSTEFGLIAEEVFSVSPKLVILNEEGEPHAINSVHLMYLMLREIQVLKLENSALKQQFQELCLKDKTYSWCG